MNNGLPPNPAHYGDVARWQQDLYRYLQQQTRIAEENNPLPVLLPWHIADERASVDGLLLYSPNYRGIVYSEGGIWRPVGMETGIFLAEQEIFREYGDSVSVASTARIISKFGRNTDLDAGVSETIWLTGGDEPYAAVGTNPIDTIVSDNVSDTSQVVVSSLIDDGSGNLTRNTETVTLNGTTTVSITACSRIEQVYVADGEAALVGNITVYESGTPANIHLTIDAGLQQSYKCAFSTASNEYVIITAVEAGVARVASAAVDFSLEARPLGSVFRPMTGRIFRNTDGTTDARETFNSTPLIVPPNYDVRLVGVSNAANVGATGIIFGHYAEIET